MKDIPITSRYFCPTCRKTIPYSEVITNHMPKPAALYHRPSGLAGMAMHAVTELPDDDTILPPAPDSAS